MSLDDNNKHVEGTEKENSDLLQDSLPTNRWSALGNRRLLFPVIYLGAAVLIIALMYERNAIWGTHPAVNPTAVGGQTSTPSTTDHTGTSNTVATGAAEKFIWPVDASAVADATVTMGYFDKGASASAKAAALIHYGNTFYPHMGYDIALSSGKSFDVVAAMAGTVTKVESNELTGGSVTVTGENGYVTEYQSLQTMDVKQGDTIRQGQVIGVSGYESLEPTAKDHLYFEVIKDNTPIDPGTVLPRK